MIREAIILAGGRGTRLQPVVSDRPKPMALVAGRPFVEWLILALQRQGVQRVALACGYLSEMVDQYLRRRGDLGLEVVVAREQAPLGTAGAARNALVPLRDDLVAVLNGDSYCPFELARLEARQRCSAATGCLWLVRVDDGGRYGTVKVSDDGRIEDFQEKHVAAGPGLINAGVYLFRRESLLSIPQGKSMSLEREFLPQILQTGSLSAEVGPGPFVDIGTPESYQLATNLLEECLKPLR